MKFYELAKLAEAGDLNQETLIKLVRVAVAAHNFTQLSFHGYDCALYDDYTLNKKCDCGFNELQRVVTSLLNQE